MKYKNKIYLLVAFLVFSACEIKWDMNVEFNENFSGKYTIKLLINEELQLYALDIGEESSIGSLNDIITDLPDGFGSSIFQEDAYLGILVRNDFDNIDELKDQFEHLEFMDHLVSYLILKMKLLINRAMKMFLMESWVLKYLEKLQNQTLTTS